MTGIGQGLRSISQIQILGSPQAQMLSSRQLGKGATHTTFHSLDGYKLRLLLGVNKFVMSIVLMCTQTPNQRCPMVLKRTPVTCGPCGGLNHFTKCTNEFGVTWACHGHAPYIMGPWFVLLPTPNFAKWSQSLHPKMQMKPTHFLVGVLGNCAQEQTSVH